MATPDRSWIERYLLHDLWRDELRELPPLRRLWIGVQRVLVHAARQFFRGEGGIRAAGLSLFTLMSIVPLLALIFGIAKGLDFKERISTAAREAAAEMPEGVDQAFEELLRLVESTSFGAIGVLGTLLLVYSGLTLFSRVEAAFNTIWRVRRRRSWLRRLSDFVALVVLVPLLAVPALVLESLLASGAVLADLEWLQGIVATGLEIVPVLMIGLAIMTMYRVMPSARVRFMPALAGGMAAGVAWTVVHEAYVRFQFGAAQAGAIYGTLAALPLLLIYLYVTWSIVIFGAEFTYAFQNVAQLRVREYLEAPSFDLRRRVGLLIVGRAVEAFEHGSGGADWEAVARELDLPLPWIEEVVEDLEAGHVVVRARDGGLVMPARPPADLSSLDVIAAVGGLRGREEEPQVALGPALERRLADADDAFARAFARGADVEDWASEVPGAGDAEAAKPAAGGPDEVELDELDPIAGEDGRRG